MFGFPLTEAFEPDEWLDDGDVIHFGQQTLQVIHTPGHTPGHVVLFSEAARLAFVGDVLFNGSIGRTDFPQGDFNTLIASIKINSGRLAAMSPSSPVMAPNLPLAVNVPATHLSRTKCRSTEDPLARQRQDSAEPIRQTLLHCDLSPALK